VTTECCDDRPRPTTGHRRVKPTGAGHPPGLSSRGSVTPIAVTQGRCPAGGRVSGGAPEETPHPGRTRIAAPPKRAMPPDTAFRGSHLVRIREQNINLLTEAQGQSFGAAPRRLLTRPPAGRTRSAMVPDAHVQRVGATTVRDAFLAG
jgi:hypothetical protein